MLPPGEIPMKVLMTKRFLAARSNPSKSCLSILRALLEPGSPPCRSCLQVQADQIVAKTALVSRAFMANQPLARLDGRFG